MRSDGISLSPHGAVSSCTGSHSLSSLLRIVSPACCHHSAQSRWSLWFCCSVCRTCRAHINHIKVFVLQETGGVMLNFAVELKCWGAGNSDGVGTSPAQGCQSVSLALVLAQENGSEHKSKSWSRIPLTWIVLLGAMWPAPSPGIALPTQSYTFLWMVLIKGYSFQTVGKVGHGLGATACCWKSRFYFLCFLVLVVWLVISCIHTYI